MNFKVKCVKYVKYVEPVSERKFTINKVYDVKSNKIVSDDGTEYTAWSLPENGDSDFKALKNWFSQWYVFELVEHEYQVGDHVVIKESNIESILKYAGKTGVIVEIGGSDHPYRIMVDGLNERIWCAVSSKVDKRVFTKKDLKNGDVVVMRNGYVGIIILEHDVIVTKTGWLNLDDVDDDLTENKFNDPDWDIVKVIRPTKQYQCQFVCAEHSDWGDVLFDKDAIPELTADEIYKKFGVRVKL